MGSHSSRSASTGRNFPATTSHSIRRQGFWALIATLFQRALCIEILCSQHLSPALAMDLARVERELFVFTGPFSPQYQEPNRDGKGE